MSSSSRRDGGFTLPELMIAITVTAMIATTIAFAILVSLRTLPGTTETADSSVAVQGITTWLPPDVDSTEPDGMDTAPGKASGCSGVDDGINLLHLSWNEEFAGVTTNYVAAYRFVVTGNTGKILRYGCSGVFTLGSPSVLEMTAPLSSTVPTVTTSDSDGDGRIDSVNFEIETLANDIVYIDAASKNPNETLPPATTNPTTTTSTTTTTVAPNNPPTAAPVSLTANPSVPVVINLPASDPDGDPLVIDLDNEPAGWTWFVSGPLQITLTPLGPAGTYVLDYDVEDPSGADATATLTVDVVSTATTTSTSTTTTTTSTTTTTTTLPPCVVSTMSVNPDPVQQKFSDPSKLKEDVDVTITLGGGYCVGLTLQYDTGAPGGQYVQNFGNAAPYTVTLLGHPAGTELWAVGTHVLEVRDGFDNLLATDTLTVNPK